MVHPRILIAPDKFKGTLTSPQAAAAIARGLKRVWPQASCTLVALTDGGEGFVEVMTSQTGGKIRTTTTVDAALRPCRSTWGVLGNGKTAVIGLANASGLAQLPLGLRNPAERTNLGTGKLIALALAQGYWEILIGLGGSATNDGGISLAAAIGYQFLDKKGDSIALTGGGLSALHRILPPARQPKAKFIVATDVENPLFGRNGAAYQFAGQKGASAAMIRQLDANLRRLAKVVENDLGLDLAAQPGAGAAGGCGYGLMAFFRARHENGFHLVRRVTKLDALIRSHDLIVTGEGCFDRTSLHGKAPWQLAEQAAKARRPVWAFCGRIQLSLRQSPFQILAGLSHVKNPGPPPETFTSAEHAQRLEELAYLTAKSADSV